jgi:azurin
LAKQPVSAKTAKSKATKELTKATVAESVTINIKVVKDLMQYNKKLFTVKAGQKVTLEFENPDGMQHNMVIMKPGTLNKVGTAVDALVQDPKGAQKSYIPNMPEVIQSVKLVDPGESVTLEFTAPAQAGDYPYICTFPGHWRIMNGIMRVVK